MVSILLVGLLLVPQLVLAQADHLECYKMKDLAVKQTYTADLAALALEPGCKVRVPAKLLCTETPKTNVTPTPPGSPPGGPAGTFACYKVKCPKVTLPPDSLSDQFGTRQVQPKKSSLLCAPAQLGSPPTTLTTTTTVPLPVACNDAIDNDGDAKIDYPNDPGCLVPTDIDETDNCPSGPGCPACANGLDDDGDTFIDYPADSSCASASGPSEGVTQCSDGVDDDGDGLTDYPNDPGCLSLLDVDETDTCPSGPGCPACGNGMDDDLDTFTDYPADIGCSAASDTTE